MNEYVFDVHVKVKVEAFNVWDAREAIDDALGLGDIGGLEIVEEQVIDCEQLPR